MSATWQLSPGTVMLIVQCLIASLAEHLGIPRAGSGPSSGVADACLASLSASSLPRMPRCPGNQTRVTSFRLASAEKASRHSATSAEVTFGLCHKCSLAIRENKNLLIFIGPSYVFTCTLHNGIYFGLTNCGKFTQREAKTSIWS
jgi:hypothetical protein